MKGPVFPKVNSLLFLSCVIPALVLILTFSFSEQRNGGYSKDSISKTDVSYLKLDVLMVLRVNYS